MKIVKARLDGPRTIWVSCLINFTINCVLVYVRPGMAMEFGSTLCVEWAAHGQPTVLFLGLLKTILVGLNWTKNIHEWCV